MKNKKNHENRRFKKNFGYISKIKFFQPKRTFDGKQLQKKYLKIAVKNAETRVLK